ncbi:Regulator of chromosome condensation (RCC1) family with FYVEzinc finger domain [Zostera marina]|uniref:Regulator of chromosome condensation (RCC1) family with FYVEzinc finger domain n=1 Tax=Zostera marina TaxID=29655 RepID=A0A0K9NM16_ZOSMR|nr:Regulator of chromosome condensation (RCC1) family with FYVEzinc finger domain [Zostera marina]
MSVRTSSSDVVRTSISSATSNSSYSSTQDDPDNLGHIYVWGHVISDKETTCIEKYDIPFASRTDVLLPRPLESNITSNLRYLSCGVRHSALVTSQGEIFTWGVESGGCLGHGVGTDIIKPRLVESSVIGNAEYVSCGEFHTCAVTASGELFTWGDGTHNVGLLGHGSNISHWIPKRVSGPLENLRVSFVACGTWHTALVTLYGQLFTFGEGAFGVLGHGDRESVLYPREVESLMGLKTITVACGVWHTAAIVEIIVTQLNSSASSGKLFTWGDGDKYRLGHGDKEPQLKPTCVPSLIDHNFQKIACGHSLTVGLTVSGSIFTMGSNHYGQLGNPYADEKIPCLVRGELADVCIEELTCGAYHVAVLSRKNDVYTWGRGANGRLGHGDIDDRKVPTLLEALKDKYVKNITCGSNFSAAICCHKLVSGSDQTHCSSCRLAFGFTRKKHNCYNCGLIHCHSCSSRKVLRAALSSDHTKPYRVCDSCYQNLCKASERSSINNKKTSAPRLPAESRDTIPLDSKLARPGKKTESLPLVQGNFNPSYLYPNDLALPTKKVFEKYVSDSLKKTNDLLNEELKRLRPQVDNLKERCQKQELEMQKLANKAHEAITHATEESAKSNVAKEVIKSLTLQLKDMAERLPSGVYVSDDMRYVRPPIIVQPHSNQNFNSYEVDFSNESFLPSDKDSTLINGRERVISDGSSLPLENVTTIFVNGNENMKLIYEQGNGDASSGVIEGIDENEEFNGFNSENASNTKSALVAGNSHVETEWTEKYTPGVYITFVSFQDGTRELKTVSFSNNYFGKHESESWLSTNREKVYKYYNIRPLEKTSTSDAGTQQPKCTSEEEISPSQ